MWLWKRRRRAQFQRLLRETTLFKYTSKIVEFKKLKNVIEYKRQLFYNKTLDSCSMDIDKNIAVKGV